MVRFSLLAAIVLQLVAVSMQSDHVLLDIRMQLGETSQANINDQINREYHAMYMYEAMTSYFGRPSVALPGFKKFFKKAADEEREHAHKLIDYLNKRGGNAILKPITVSLQPSLLHINFLPIMKPNIKYEWSSALEAVKQALEAEKNITTHLYSLRNVADAEKDSHLVDFIESEFLTEQVNGISELREMIAKLDRVGSGLGEYMIDKELN